MFSSAKKLVFTAVVLMTASSVALAQEAKQDPDAPIPPGQGADTVFGPDTFGYIGYDSDEFVCDYDFVDITATGAVITSGDEGSGVAALGGTGFEFYGDLNAALTASTNGYLSTDGADTGGDLSNDCPLPVAPSTGGGARLYPLHDDLISGSVLYEYFAACPRAGVFGNEACHVFQWNDVEFWASGLAAGDFQAVLYETSRAIVFQQGSGNQELGSGSTTGIQNLGATDGLTYACDTADSVLPDTAQCIFHPEAPGFPTIDSAATFRVVKTFDDGNPGSVEVTLSCNTGLPLVQSDDIAEGDDVTFVVTDFADGTMDCEVTETAGFDGYAQSYYDLTTTSPDSCVFEDVALNSGQGCEISNSLQFVTVEVTKEWIDENPQFDAVNYAEATYTCSNEQFVETFGSLEFFGNPDTEGFDVFPHWDGTTTCTVTESVVEGGVEADASDCQSVSVTVGGSASCTIVNTRMYEGIPTLSQYGLALMAFLMLGLGFVAFRRMS